MSYQVLARKWRPQKFQEVVGQDHITRALVNSIKLQQVGHAYIFSGTRGVGKTSLARIFAQAVRCLHPDTEGNPCHNCPACHDFNTNSSLNIVEIDGASNNSVENVRDLIANAQYLPTVGKYKVYIIDEVHMLSVAAFNALLKTLEEPPAHVIFILATTAPEKLPDTVLSRCQSFEFRKVGMADLKKLVEKIGQAEKITWQAPHFIDVLCQQGQGSVRDTLSLLEQVLSFAPLRNIDENALAAALGVAKDSMIEQLAKVIWDAQTAEVRNILQKALAENVTAKNIFKALLDYYYRQLTAPAACADTFMAERLWLYEVLAQDATWALASLNPEQALEMILIKLAQRRTFFKQSSTRSELGPVNGNQDTQQGLSTAAATSGQAPMQGAASVGPSDNSEQQEDFTVNLAAAPAKMKVKEEERKQEHVSDKANIGQNPETPTTEKSKLRHASWAEFLDFVGNRSPSLRANLEQGNLLGEIIFTTDQLRINIGLCPTEKVFWEYLQDHDIHQKICRFLGEFFSLEVDHIDLKLTLLTEAQKQELGFVSLAEQDKVQTEQQENSRETGLRNDPLIKEAENIFHAAVDKVILNAPM
ncbi:MAG: DNA polymerase III subunit gamma/tau [Bacteriovoracaceae bacterium]|nr:DNA polymerase III subunit gamma/tau [Bacteriovoracaceae bacterium]